MKKFWNWIHNEAGGRVLRLEGPIDDESFWGDEVTPKAFREELNADAGDITVWINSPGGNVFAAAEIYTMLRDYPGAVTVKIDAIAASAASVIAMAGSKVLMSPVAMPNGYVKAKTSVNTSDAVYNAWYDAVYEPQQTAVEPEPDPAGDETASG